jgi:transposase-like protein
VQANLYRGYRFPEEIISQCVWLPEQHYLWRAVDQHGAVIDILVQPKRDRFAAIRFFRKLLRTSGRQPRVIITDRLRSYGAAKKVILPRVTHRQSRYLNNRLRTRISRLGNESAG